MFQINQNTSRYVNKNRKNALDVFSTYFFKGISVKWNLKFIVSRLERTICFAWKLSEHLKSKNKK